MDGMIKDGDHWDLGDILLSKHDHVHTRLYVDIGLAQ